MENKNRGILFEANVEEVYIPSLTMEIADWSDKEVTIDNWPIPFVCQSVAQDLFDNELLAKSMLLVQS